VFVSIAQRVFVSWLSLGYDCGVFTCFFADFISRDYPLFFKQEDVTRYRSYMARKIIEKLESPKYGASVNAL